MTDPEVKAMLERWERDGITSKSILADLQNKGWVRVKRSLIERMENLKAPKTWIAEVTKLGKIIEEKDALLAEYLEVIDALARIVEEYEAGGE